MVGAATLQQSYENRNMYGLRTRGTESKLESDERKLRDET